MSELEKLFYRARIATEYPDYRGNMQALAIIHCGEAGAKSFNIACSAGWHRLFTLLLMRVIAQVLHSSTL
ncbi:hypothetical protein DWB85_12565 [Seongchinamella sediminis]|uniref:Uncharacterized protein n=1 Tax=Seongchinamella sediminis TaxID=2283635 RepID=A0A3L7DXM4_9GAMM|nr:hypothetical protein [Seongchinamella sediminis]RLQ21359.1 hypothetical protein DWB85_12565 [Seongchinamella sediminis]